MSRPLTVALKSKQGSWIALPNDPRARRLGQEEIPILRVWDETAARFDAPAGRYVGEAHSLGAGRPADWWNEARHAGWKALLAPGNLTALRKGAPGSGGSGTVDRWIGVYRIRSVTLDDARLTVDVEPTRVAEVAQ
jgi:hypothetical protein